MNNDNWKTSLEGFFAQRGQAVSGHRLGLEELAYVSGRDPRVWTPQVYDDMILDILNRLNADEGAKMLEVGCASGFLAQGLAVRVATYDGVDIAAPALVAARQLNLTNAHFVHSDGAALPFEANSFDSSLCYDVFTNFPNFQIGGSMIEEMLRVTRPGGRILIGSIPDAALQEEYSRKVVQVAKELQDKHGPLSSRYLNLSEAARNDTRSWLQRILRKPKVDTNAAIQCYYFEKLDFERLGEKLRVDCRIFDVHALNPYKGFRFNVVYTKPNR